MPTESTATVTAELSRRIAAAAYDAIPPAAVAVAKTVILDGLAVTLAGSVEPTARIAAEYAREMNDAGKCSVFGQGFQTSPVLAAFVNGVAGHVLDYEVMWHPATHATSPTLPGILALAEMRGQAGPEVLTALVTGFEVQGRIRVASASLGLGGFSSAGAGRRDGQRRRLGYARPGRRPHPDGHRHLRLPRRRRQRQHRHDDQIHPLRQRRPHGPGIGAAGRKGVHRPRRHL